MSNSKPFYGITINNIPYARIGQGKKSLLLLTGGPGNSIPMGMGFDMIIGSLKRFLSEYTIYMVSRKSGLPEGHTTKDMSDDIAELIQMQFAGHVEVVIGMSYGGTIAQHFAADHADLCDHLIIAMATHKISEAGKLLDTRYAELLSQGKSREAAALIVQVLYPPGPIRWIMRGVVWLLGGALLGIPSPTFRQDVQVEIQAELNHNATESLKRIKIPILILIGGNDYYFEADSAKEMAAMIPEARFKIYPGKGHEIMGEKEFAQDVAEFIGWNDGQLEFDKK
jgi:pimeloyl-ACP methyl ester carboxylesterase